MKIVFNPKTKLKSGKTHREKQLKHPWANKQIPIQTPYANNLLNNGLAQHNLKHN